jgi:hypothetical protein
MSLSERVQQLNREIGATLERALSELRQGVSQHLRTGSEEVLRRIEQLAPELPRSFLAHEDLAPVAEEMSGEARRGAFGELRDGLAAIDRARSQAEILNALLQESGRFASRAAVLLTRAGELRGWGAHGFAEEPAIRDLVLALPEDGAWNRLAAGQGTVPLSAADCALLCSRVESPLPRDGVLVPLVLRDRVAAALYADHLDHDELAVEALQVLAYGAAQAIESLPFRERPSTPTLQLESAAPAAEPASAAAVTEAAEPAPAPVEEVEEEERQGEVGEDTAVAVAAPAAEPEPEAAPALHVEPEPAAAAPLEPVGEDTPWTVEAEPEAAPELSAEPAAEPDWTPPQPAPEAPPAVAAEPAAPTQAVDLREVPAAAPPVAEPRPEPAAHPEETVLLQRSTLREPAAPPLRPVPPVAAPPLDPVRSAAPAGTPEVKPPSGVQGPGWAFATTRVPVAPSDESMHEEARRLARLLVSEIKLYNEEQVEEGRRNRDIYERLKEDIDRSRQMYEERVEPRILKSTDYFYQELVRILAAGDSKALGI